MMRLSRHIGLTVFNAVFMALIVVVGLDVVAEIIDETRAIERNYGFTDVFMWVLSYLRRFMNISLFHRL